MKMSRSKKRVAAMMMVSALSLWFALPNVAHAKDITIEGRTIHTYLTGNSSSATATISYTEGPGQVKVRVTGYARDILDPNRLSSKSGPENSNPAPGGASSNVSAPNGCEFYRATSACWFDVYINGITFSGPISDEMNLW